LVFNKGKPSRGIGFFMWNFHFVKIVKSRI
jgi:hypothetical protein